MSIPNHLSIHEQLMYTSEQKDKSRAGEKCSFSAIWPLRSPIKGHKWCFKNYFHASFQLISFSMSKIAWSDPNFQTTTFKKSAAPPAMKRSGTVGGELGRYTFLFRILIFVIVYEILVLKKTKYLSVFEKEKK